jgi:hypothetical protein
MVIDIDGVLARSGWILTEDGTLFLATPFTGFVRRVG